MGLQLRFFSVLSIYFSFVLLEPIILLWAWERCLIFPAFVFYVSFLLVQMKGQHSQHVNLSHSLDWKCQLLLDFFVEVLCGSQKWKIGSVLKNVYDNIHLNIFSDSLFAVLGNMNVVFSLWNIFPGIFLTSSCLLSYHVRYGVMRPWNSFASTWRSGCQGLEPTGTPSGSNGCRDWHQITSPWERPLISFLLLRAWGLALTTVEFGFKSRRAVVSQLYR